MPDKLRGRPPKPIAPGAPVAAAALGAKLRQLRTDRGLTQLELGQLAGYTPQHISEVERTKSKATAKFVYDCDRALNADILHRAPVVGDDLRGLAHRLAAA